MAASVRDDEVWGVLSSDPSPFACLSDDHLQHLRSAMQVREYAAGDYLIRQGEPSPYLLLLVEGTAWAGVRGATGDHTQVAEFVRGDVVGERSLVTDETRTADVVARTLVRVLVLPGDDFHDLAHRYPELQVLMTEVVADRLGQTTYDGLGGKDIHGYRINRCVGRGGMGVVYEALRLSDGEVVAVKMMSHKLVYQPDALLRFRREAATLEALHHEVIASL